MDAFILELDKRLKTEVYNDIICKTNKHFKTPYENKRRTKGLILSAFNCGIVNGFRELFGAESITQIVLFYLGFNFYYCSLLNSLFLLF